MTVVRYKQGALSAPPMSAFLEEVAKESTLRFPDLEREVFAVAEIPLQAIRAGIENSHFSQYDRRKLDTWLGEQGVSDIEIGSIQSYIARLIARVCSRLIEEQHLDLYCIKCETPIKQVDMTRDEWRYYANPTFAGSGYFLICPAGHALYSIQTTIS